MIVTSQRTHRVLVAFTLLIISCLGQPVFGEKLEKVPAVEPDSFVAEKIPIADDLRLNDRFDYSTYWGTIRSQKELDKIWSGLVNIQKTFYHKPGAIVPPAPQVDFSTNMVLWFAERGVNASFVESVALSPDKTSNTLNVLVTVFHSDFGSSHLNLWKIPRTKYNIVLKVKHKYETRGP